MVARWYQSTWVSSVDCHISINFSLPSWTCLLLFGFIICTFDAFPGLFSVNSNFLLPYCHVPWGKSPNSFIGYKLHPPDVQCQHDVKCNFHMLCVTLHKSELCYRVTNNYWHRLSTKVWSSQMSMIKCMGLTHTWPIISHNENTVCVFGVWEWN